MVLYLFYFSQLKEVLIKANVTFQGKQKFKIKIRNFEIETDLPENAGGDDSALTPPELFIASLGSCIGVFVSAYLKNTGVSAEGLSIDVDSEYADSPRRIGKISVGIKVPNIEQLGKRKQALLKVAQNCTIHNTLENKPQISINME